MQLILAALLAILIASGLLYSQFRKRKHWLSYYIDLAKAESRMDSGLIRWRFRLSDTRRRFLEHLASSKSLFSILVAVALLHIILYLIGDLSGLRWFDKDRIQDFVSILWQVQAGVLGITFVVVVFLLQSILTQQQREEGLFQLYVRESYILPIAFLGIVTIGSIGILFGLTINPVLHDGQLSLLVALNVSLFFFNLLLIAQLYWRTFQFLSPSYLDRAITEVVRARVQESVEEEITRRLGWIILQRKAQELGIEFMPEFAPAQAGVIPIRMTIDHDALVVKDVDLKRLEKFVERVRENKGKRRNVTPYAWLAKGYGSTISFFHDEMGYVLATDYSEDLTSLLKSCLKTKKYVPADPLGESLNYLKGRISWSIQSRQPAELEKLLNIYVQAIQDFLDAMRQYNITFTSTMARQALGFEWQPVSRIEKDLYDVLELVMRTDDRELIGHVIYLPVKMLRLAVTYGDHLIFQRFGNFFPNIYLHACRTLEGHLSKEYVLDRSWRYLDEFCRLYLEPQAGGAHAEAEEIVNLSEYVKDIIIVFNRLLKRAIDFEDLQAYRNFGDVLDSLFEHTLRRTDYEADRMQIQMQIENWEGTEDGRRTLQQRLKCLERASKAFDEIALNKSEVWFGIGGWLINLYRAGQISADRFQEFFSKASGHFTNLSHLAKVFAAVRQEDFRGDRFSWDWWDMEGRERRAGRTEVVAINTDTWLTWFYVIRGLALTPQVIDPTGTPIPPREGMDHLVAAVQDVCSEVQDNLSKWKNVLPAVGLEDRVENFINLHQRAAAEQKRIEEDRLIAKEISEEKWEEFKQIFLKNWERMAVLRRIIEQYGNFADKTNEPAPARIKRFGLSIRDHKGAFVEDEGIFIGWGSEHARAIARREDKLILSVLANQIAIRSEASDAAHLVNRIDEALRHLRDGGYAPNVILIGSWRLIKALINSKNFVPRWHQECPQVDIQGYEGSYDSIPVFLVVESEDDQCYVLDLSRVGSLTQYQVEEAPGQVFWFDIQPIDDDKALALIRSQPELRRDKSTGQFRSTEQVVRELKQQVWLQIWERLDFEVSDGKAGAIITARLSGNGAGES